MKRGTDATERLGAMLSDLMLNALDDSGTALLLITDRCCVLDAAVQLGVRYARRKERDLHLSAVCLSVPCMTAGEIILGQRSRSPCCFGTLGPFRRPPRATAGFVLLAAGIASPHAHSQATGIGLRSHPRDPSVGSSCPTRSHMKRAVYTKRAVARVGQELRHLCPSPLRMERRVGHRRCTRRQ